MQPSNTELILIRVTGEDRPGLTASVTEILAKYDATILDIGQADIHNKDGMHGVGSSVGNAL